MQLFAITIAILSIHCAFGEQCQKSSQESTDECIQIIHPQHGKLLGNITYMAEEYQNQIEKSLKDVQNLINNSSSVSSGCMKTLLNSVNELSKSYMTKIIMVDANVKHRFMGVYIALMNAIKDVQGCVDRPHVSCEEIRTCCSSVENALYAERGVSVEKISNFLVEFKTQYSSECETILNTIYKLQEDVNDCKAGVTNRKAPLRSHGLLSLIHKSSGSLNVVANGLLVIFTTLSLVMHIKLK
ncbi:hypothetical protein PPYR_11246 [Photinus pyralis]|uniref:Protein TsetseEP domain-containing protein n=1 Tax=Photinus pyralis TaxID=7054 RepID=A0A1Y1MNK4_PHOPY|nr:uncharacterized protein LOC116177482 [Photinus pyralis]KAB0794407.1 hypothetical protein PPYR_11246 [Photinus pyralis]